MNLKEFDKLYQVTVEEAAKVVDFPENWNEWRYVVSGRFTRMIGGVQYATKKLGFSKQFINFHSADAVKDVIIHELVHVLTEGHGHDKVWKNLCLKIGGTGEETVVTSKEYKRTIMRYELYCPNCGKIINYYRRKSNKKRACGKCCKEFNRGAFSERYLLEYRDIKDE